MELRVLCVSRRLSGQMWAHLDFWPRREAILHLRENRDLPMNIPKGALAGLGQFSLGFVLAFLKPIDRFGGGDQSIPVPRQGALKPGQIVDFIIAQLKPCLN